MHTQYHQIIPKNTKGRDFIIGDIHGYYKMFQEALNSVAFDPDKDRLFSLGDLIDRGSNNLKILKLAQSDWFYTVRGNHEQMLCDGFEFPLAKPGYASSIKSRFDAQELHRDNGGKWFYRLKDEALRDCIYQELSQLPYVISLETDQGLIGLTHAEIPEVFESWDEFIQSINTDSKTRDNVVWNRLAIESVYDVSSSQYYEAQFRDEERFIEGVIASVHGHSSVHEPVVCGSQVWIDTGRHANNLTILSVSDLLDMIDRR